MGFWEHAEALRGVLLRMVAFLAVLTVVLFAAMPSIFDSVILAPCHGDFVTYQWLDKISEASSLSDTGGERFEVHFVNIRLASQFFIHTTTAFWLAVVISFPVCVYMLWGFVSPGLYEEEKRGIRWAFLAGNLMFFLGVATGYFLVFPLTLRFLADYQLSALIPNQISLDSYMDNFLALILVMGIVFELPLVTWIVGKTGVLTRGVFTRYRRHAVVVLLIAAAVITPTGDPFTLTVVFLPLYILWELSAFSLPLGHDTINTSQNIIQ